MIILLLMYAVIGMLLSQLSESVWNEEMFGICLVWSRTPRWPFSIMCSYRVNSMGRPWHKHFVSYCLRSLVWFMYIQVHLRERNGISSPYLVICEVFSLLFGNVTLYMMINQWTKNNGMPILVNFVVTDSLTSRFDCFSSFMVIVNSGFSDCSHAIWSHYFAIWALVYKLFIC